MNQQFQRNAEAFTVNPAAPHIDVRSLQTTANLRAGSAKGVETKRQAILADRHGGAYSVARPASKGGVL